MEVGLVVPAYDHDPDVTYPYLRRLDEALSLDTILLELDDIDEAPTGLPETVDVHRVGHRRGKGAAIRCGFDHLDEDVLVAVDDDASVPPSSVRRLIEAVEEGADMAVGSRRHPACRDVSHASVVRRRLGDAFAWSARRLLRPRLYDYQCGAKALAAPAWRDARALLGEDGFGWDVDAVTAVHATGGAVEEIPIRWSDTPGSRVNVVSASLDLASAVVRCAVRRSARAATDRPVRFRGLISDGSCADGQEIGESGVTPIVGDDADE